MGKVEYRQRLKVLGYTVEEFQFEVGMGVTGWRNWVEVPRWAEYWLYWKEAEGKLSRMREILDA